MADPPLSSPPLEAQAEPGARDLSRVKSKDGTVPTDSANPPPDTAWGHRVLPAIDLFRFIQNNQECSSVHSRTCEGLQIQADHQPSAPSVPWSFSQQNLDKKH